MILHNILGALAVVSCLSTVWQWLAARRFPLHQRSADLRPGALEFRLEPASAHKLKLELQQNAAIRPAVTLLKPLKGADEFTESCLRSWLAQNYPGEIQALFGVAGADDPACAVVKKLLAEFPQRDAQLVVCPERLGANAKVSKLAQLEPLAKHDIIVVSDADVRVPADLLANVVATLGEEGRAGSFLLPRGRGTKGEGETLSRQSVTVLPHPGPLPLGEGDLPAAPAHNGGAHGGTRPTHTPVGLVNCFYRFANPTTPAMQWEAIAVNADFWSQVLQGASFRKLDFALGAVMATRRKGLAEIGGFRALTDCLADDFQLGNRIARRGCQIEICPVVVECWSPPMGWREVWRHQLRWARTIRGCQPLPYFFSIVSNATLWPLLWAVAALPSIVSQSGGDFSGKSNSVEVALPWVLFWAVVFLLVRGLVADDLQRRLTPSHSRFCNFWLVPVKDLLQAALWAGAFAGNHIEWRGERYRLRRDGTLNKE